MKIPFSKIMKAAKVRTESMLYDAFAVFTFPCEPDPAGPKPFV